MNNLLRYLLLLCVLSASVIFVSAETHTNNGDMFKVVSYTNNGMTDDMIDGKIICHWGDVINLYFTLTRENSLDFTDIQFDLVFPEGIRPYPDQEWECYGWEGEDIPLRAKRPVVAYSDNMDMPEKYPVHSVIGVNMNKTAITNNPCEVYVLSVKVDDDATPCVCELKVKNLKYTSFDNDTWVSSEPQTACVFAIMDYHTELTNDKLSMVNLTMNANETSQATIAFANELNGSGVHFKLHFPPGIRPSGFVNEATDMNLNTNLDNGTAYPDYFVNEQMVESIGASSTHMRGLITIDVQTDDNIAPGSYDIVATDLKRYRDLYNTDDGYGSYTYLTVGEQTVCTITVPEKREEGGYTDISKMTYAIYADSVRARKGKTCELKINMKNSNAITLWQTDMVLPAGFSIATDEWGDPAVSISGNRTNTSRHAITSQMLTDGSIRLLCSSNNNNGFLDSDGEVATITLNVADNVENGDYPVVFNKILLVENNESSHRVQQVVSKITVKNYILGDVNDDGEINGIDLVGLTNFIMERPNESNIFEAADVNCDGVIDGADFVREVNAIMGRLDLNAASVKRASSIWGGNFEVNGHNIAADAGSAVQLILNVNNDAPFTLWQSDITLPQGISASGVSLIGNRTSDKRHSVNSGKLSNGNLRILCGSSSNSEFAHNSGEVASITLNIDKDMMPGTYAIDLSNGIVVEANGKSHQVNASTIYLTVGAVTGIIDIPVENAPVNVFNTQGQLVRGNVSPVIATEGLTPGLYLVGNKKVHVK